MIYNVILKTENRTNPTSVICKSEYFFDWSVLPEGKYKLSFSFISSNVNQSSVDFIPILNAALGQTTNFTADPLRISAITTNTIGVLIPYVVSTASYLYADKNINHPIILNRPSQNNFRVDILDDTNGSWTGNDAKEMDSYVLTLSFELQGSRETKVSPTTPSFKGQIEGKSSEKRSSI